MGNIRLKDFECKGQIGNSWRETGRHRVVHEVELVFGFGSLVSSITPVVVCPFASCCRCAGRMVANRCTVDMRLAGDRLRYGVVGGTTI